MREHDNALRLHDALARRLAARLVAGARAAPKEDTGGHGAYWQMVEIAESGDADAEALRWIGDWRPEQFDLEAGRASFDQPGEANHP